jgi:hypothetical protein
MGILMTKTDFGSSSRDTPADSREEKIARIVAEYTDRVNAREPCDFRQMLDGHGDLSPELEETLQVVDAIRAGVRGYVFPGSNPDSTTFARLATEDGLRVRDDSDFP